MLAEDLCEGQWLSGITGEVDQTFMNTVCGGRYWRTFCGDTALWSLSDLRRQVNVDGTQRRHDGQVKEGEAGQLDLKGGSTGKRAHGEQRVHRLINPAPFAIQDVPHRTETVLSVCVG